MKLLTKKEITSETAQAQKQTYDEGMKLARRVDSLREVASAEEASLAQFRVKTIASIHEEITTETAKRDRLRKEVSDLQKEREEALKPVHEEQEAVQKEREQLENEKLNLEHERETLGILRESTERDSQNAKDELHRAKGEHQLSSTILSEAHTKEKESEKLLAKANETLIASVAVKQALDTELEVHRTQALAAQNRQTKRDKDQDAREKELNARETRLLDREAMLARNIQRHGSTNSVPER